MFERQVTILLEVFVRFYGFLSDLICVFFCFWKFFLVFIGFVCFLVFGGFYGFLEGFFYQILWGFKVKTLQKYTYQDPPGWNVFGRFFCYMKPLPKSMPSWGSWYRTRDTLKTSSIKTPKNEETYTNTWICLTLKK